MNEQSTLSPSLAPPHSLNLPGPVWGMDPSTKRLSVAVLAPRFRPVFEPPPTYKPNTEIPTPDVGKEAFVAVDIETFSYSQAGAMQHRLAAALRTLLHGITDLRRRTGDPVAIYLEEPFGGSDKPGPGGKIIKPHPNSFYFLGVVLNALGHCFAEVPVTLLAPTTWKAKAIGQGHGFAKKPEIMAWAHSIGYEGNLEDEADALGVATAGAVILTS
jgi:hypothetical protein